MSGSDKDGIRPKGGWRGSATIFHAIKKPENKGCQKEDFFSKIFAQTNMASQSRPYSDGFKVKAHRSVLSSTSSLFKEILIENHRK